MNQKTGGVFVIYSRKSKFTGKGESVENQVELCRQYISGMFGPGDAADALVYEDEGFSGGNLDRPRFRQMMQDSHRQKFAAIVVYRLDRISRNISDFAGLIQDLGERSIDFISIREQFDTSSPMGRAMMYIASVFSQLERETIAERIRDNMHELAKTGRWLGGVTPLGYTSEGVSRTDGEGRIRKACRLRPVPEELAQVRLIYDRFLETGSLTGVDRCLLEQRQKTRRGMEFSRYAIRAILSNPVYLTADADARQYLLEHHVELFSDKTEFDGTHGVMAYNRTLQHPGRTSQLNPMEEWIVAVGQHPGLIPGAQWIAVQDKLEVNRSKCYRRPRSSLALLSGVLFCGDCGSYMRPKAGRRSAASGEPRYLYMCTRKERSRSQLCQIRSPNGRLLDGEVLRCIKGLDPDKEAAARYLAASVRTLENTGDEDSAEADRLRSALAETEAQSRALVDALTRAAGTAAEKYILERIEELNRDHGRSTKRLAELEAAAAQQQLSETELEQLCCRLSHFAGNVDDYSLEQKRAAVRSLIRQVVWDGEMLHIYLQGAEAQYRFPTPAPDFPGEALPAAQDIPRI